MRLQGAALEIKVMVTSGNGRDDVNSSGATRNVQSNENIAV